jgi:hypothetical protein
MPESYRKPRARLRPEVEAPDTALSILQAQHAAGRDPEAWAALRSRSIRHYIAKGHAPEQAARIFDAFAKKPQFLPMLPPRSVQDNES